MSKRTVFTDDEHKQAITAVHNTKPPFELTITKGSKRSLEQNALAFKWYQEVAGQRGDMTVNEVRAECKLIFGVPILRREKDAFRETYDRCLKALPYEAKLEFIKTTELPVTSLMTTGQLSEYLTAMLNHFTAQGLQLTIPEERHVA